MRAASAFLTGAATGGLAVFGALVIVGGIFAFFWLDQKVARGIARRVFR